MGTQAVTLLTEDGEELRVGIIADGEALVREGNEINGGSSASGGGLTMAQAAMLVSYRG